MMEFQSQPSSSASLPYLFYTGGAKQIGSFIQCACSEPSHTILILSRGTTVYLNGAFSFQVLYGFVDINGCLFPPKKYNSANFVNVVVPSGHLPTAFSIRDDLSVEFNFDRIKSRMRDFVNDPSKVFKFASDMRPICVLLIKTEMNIMTRFACQQTLQTGNGNILPDWGTKLGKHLFCGNTVQPNGERAFRCIGRETIEMLKRLENSYRDVIASIYQSLGNLDHCIVPVIGNKGSGKSTTTRFLINGLNTGPNDQPPKPTCRVFLLDLDVGQSELCPSGCISLFEVKKPLIGTPFAHQESTLANSYLFGSNTPCVDFNLYAKLVALQVGKFHEQRQGLKEKCVLIVNTLGWIEDQGYDLMLRVLHIIQPMVMVCMEMPRFPGGKLSFEIPRNYLPIAKRIQNTKLNQFFDTGGTNKSAELSFTPKAVTLRGLLVAAYLAQTLTQTNKRYPLGSNIPLADAFSYRLRFCTASVYIHPELRHVDDKFLLCALNCALVALCKVENGYENCFERKHLLDDPSYPSRLVLRQQIPEELTEEPSRESGELSDDDSEILPIERPMPVLRCVGFGLVRAINPERKLFYIITPAEQRSIRQVDVLALGHGLNTPDLVFDTKSVGQAPYLVELQDHGLEEHHRKFFSPLHVVARHRRPFMANRAAAMRQYQNRPPLATANSNVGTAAARNGIPPKRGRPN